MCAQKIAASKIQKEHMERARFMASHWNRWSIDRNYSFIVKLLNDSSSKAGGPALRLANAIWDFEYRLMFPKSNQLQVREENSFSWLKENYNPSAKQAKYRVWKAVSAFIQMREHAFPQALLITTKEDLCLSGRDAVIDLFEKLHDMRHPRADRIAVLLMGINPAEYAHLVERAALIIDVAHARVRGGKNVPGKMKKMNAMANRNSSWIGKTSLSEIMAIATER